VRISKEPIFDSKFLAGSRPLIFPLVLKLFGNNEEAVVWAQGMFSILSWGLLAVAVASSLHLTFLRIIAFGMILVLSFYRYVIAWDSVLLTESVSLSLMALFLASWLWLVKSWRWHKVALLSFVTLLWTFSRDTNAWVVFMVALFLLVLVVLRQIDKKYLVPAIAFVGMFLLSNLSADHGDRWVFPFQNILGRRILSDTQAVNFFANCGMPVSPSLMERAGGYANSSDRAFYEDSALEGYRVWLHENGKSCYVKWLLTNPLESVRRPIAEFDSLVSMQNIQPFLFSKNFSPVLPGRLEAILFPRQALLFVSIVLLGLALIAILGKAWTQNKSWWIIIGMILLIFPHYFITWHGDVMGIYRMKYKVLLTAPYMIPVVDRFRSIFDRYDIELIIPPVQERMEETDLLQYAGQFDGTICGDDRYTARVIEACCPRLRVISKWGTGVDSIDAEACSRYQIKLGRTQNAFTLPVADTVLGYILAFARRQPWMDREMKSGKWEKLPGKSLSEYTLGIIGVGNIGKAVTRRARAFGMKIYGTDIVDIDHVFITETGIEMTDLQTLLSRSDFVSINCDLNPTSYHLINSDTLALMKSNAVLINTARGPIVEEQALIEALQVKRLAGAALDVFEQEPLPFENPLQKMDNVLLAPHNANSSPAAWERVHWNTIRNLVEGLGLEYHFTYA
jgi:D-3-phosphoglycerate dehydrogenase